MGRRPKARKKSREVQKSYNPLETGAQFNLFSQKPFQNDVKKSIELQTKNTSFEKWTMFIMLAHCLKFKTHSLVFMNKFGIYIFISFSQENSTNFAQLL